MLSAGLKQVWQYVRQVSGDDAYERYLAHHRQAHTGEAPMTQEQHFKKHQEEKWSKVSRCC